MATNVALSSMKSLYVMQAGDFYKVGISFKTSKRQKRNSNW
jgi:hypothetical protein